MNTALILADVKIDRPEIPATPEPVLRQTLQRPNNVLVQVIVVLCCVAMSVGVIVFTTAAERAQKKTPPRDPPPNMPMHFHR
jgi:hypothetical protein